MQYPSSFPHQHDPVLSCAGCPPCHVRSWPWVEELLERVYRKIVPRINSADASRSFRVVIASTMFPLRLFRVEESIVLVGGFVALEVDEGKIVGLVR